MIFEVICWIVSPAPPLRNIAFGIRVISEEQFCWIHVDYE